MAKRSYVPRHAVPVPPAAPVARKAVTVLAASVGVAAATTALATSATASQADAAAHHHHMGVWDRVASCESGRRWHVDTGNGYYGGLQFSASTWRAYHGHKYAGDADHATRMEQIQVARRVLKSQGRDAWPVCGPRAGLTKHNGHATAAALPNNPNRMPGDHHHKNPLHRHHPKSHHHKTVQHGTHHKSRTHHSHVYIVRRGDTLSSIAHKEHVAGGWHALYRANRKHVHNPDVLHVGQHLLIP